MAKTPHTRSSDTLEGGYCILIPMFNEENNVESCFESIYNVIRNTSPRGRLLVVEDGSSDQTWEKLEKMRSRFPETLLERHEGNQGYGAALRTGIRCARKHGFAYALFMDSDLTTDPKYIAPFLEKMKEGHDVIKATRYGGGGRMSGVPPHRAFISWLGNWIARRFFPVPITDCTNGFRALKVPLLARLPLSENGFVIILEELYYATGIAKSYADVPYTLTSRGPDQGKSNFVYHPKVFFQYLKYVLLNVAGKPHIPEEKKSEAPL